ncbi:hypothetical protein JQV27_16245 [Sulfitobacter mediterraneus]|jgi:hypothetical protein|uniref:hypothetical protein n=2 Tax=Roseobacteraceae TaxID=2854170 RepID=UPI001933364B|nr:hypothetical protein [Sulfitobacter mediterraneus]UWR14862.1 hypothetical protein K3754_16475 [Sulfitobacter sp. M368]MBM1634402.1 hypothetical protein [Sulfitobacter mediterraneus]MBM1642219.1 hypothetical protein [Sulfitobacter mediterraneus]MBM1646268.1 hypothetical protein [Sulfitobacter mediterraneus]MBM1650314.1 hypothetical protein [Sulfitobacter mediterraneus]
MLRIMIALVAMLGLTACGGSRYSSANARGYKPAPVLFATGPIQKACQQANRKAASRARCGCVQAVADRELSNADQRRGAKMFSDPHKLQEIRQSDNASNERFWKAWKAYGKVAAELCSAS